MPEVGPTVYTEHIQPTSTDAGMVVVRLPVDVADELTVTTLWLSIQLGHRLPMAVLRRALVLNGVANAGHVLATLQGLRLDE